MKNILSKILKPEIVFVYFAFVFGIIFVLINPPFQGPDEDSHLYKAYGFTEGSFSYKKLSIDGNKCLGHVVPYNLGILRQKFAYLAHNSYTKTKVDEIKKMRELNLDNNVKAFDVVAPTSYTVFSYIPEVLVTIVLKAINCKPLYMLYILRFCCLLVYLALTYCAIKTTPVKKWLFTALGVMPMSVYMGSVVNTDCITLGISFLAFAYLLKLYFSDDEKYSGKQIAVLSLLFAYMFICKAPYVALILLFFILPKSKISDKTRIVSVCSVLSAFVILVLYTFYTLSLAKGYDNPKPFTPYSSGEILSMIFRHPVLFFISLLKTPFVQFNYGLKTFIGTFGWLDTYIPLWVSYLYGIVIVFFSVFNISEEKVLSCKAKVLFGISTVGAYILTAVACCLIFFFYPDGSICGIQGRYYIPFALGLFLLVQNSRFVVKKEWLWIVLFLLITHFVYFTCIINILNRYYT